jgi:signal transduction histidine kinase
MAWDINSKLKADMSMNTLKGKLVLSYVIISLMIVVSLSVLFNLFVDNIFEEYAFNQQKKKIEEIITQVNQQYVEESGLYNLEGIAIIANAALQNGIMVHVRTLNNEIDWDVRQHKAQECQLLLQHAETNMHSRYPNFQGGYAEDTFDLKNNDELVGYLTAGYYGPYSLSDNELLLLHALNRTILVLSGIFLVVAVIIGVIMAKRITAPITSVIRTSKLIADGNYGTQTKESSSTRETADLITSINEMSQALAIKEKQKKQITADVAHELRTPLFNLQGHMEAMIDQVLEPTADRLKNCHSEILRLTQIVEQLQELYVLENNHVLFTKTYFDFSDLCDSVSADFELSADRKGIGFLFHVPEPAPVYGDLFRLKQCFMNLVSNSINYTAEGGIIQISYEKSSHAAIIRIKDNGAGIPQEDLPHIFERFYRADKSRNHANGGMGIGLSITKVIIEAHGGTISVESCVGSGTTFIVTLPDSE